MCATGLCSRWYVFISIWIVCVTQIRYLYAIPLISTYRHVPCVHMYKLHSLLYNACIHTYFTIYIMYAVHMCVLYVRVHTSRCTQIHILLKSMLSRIVSLHVCEWRSSSQLSMFLALTHKCNSVISGLWTYKCAHADWACAVGYTCASVLDA